MNLIIEGWWNLTNEEIKRKGEPHYTAKMLFSWVIDKNVKEFYKPKDEEEN